MNKKMKPEQLSVTQVCIEPRRRRIRDGQLHVDQSRISSPSTET